MLKIKTTPSRGWSKNISYGIGSNQKGCGVFGVTVYSLV
jgi:hypothetical protein